jgi:hypothetical protein
MSRSKSGVGVPRVNSESSERPIVYAVVELTTRSRNAIAAWLARDATQASKDRLALVSKPAGSPA